MNILYVIGNGFDINLGLKTEFKNFLDYYLGIESNESSAVKDLKDNIKSDIDTWADFELEFGKYTGSIAKDDFLDVYENIVSELANYLSEESSKLNIKAVNRSAFYNDLINPEKHLLPANRQIIEEYKDRWAQKNWNVDIVTFNYTNSIISICGGEYNNLIIGSHHPNAQNLNNRNVTLKSIIQLHGDVDNRMILGVNDISQIGNKSYLHDPMILRAMVKTLRNSTNGYQVDAIFKDKINKADLICIYGSSIGRSDQFWWEFIGQRLKNGAKLLLFDYTKDYKPLFEYRVSARRNQIKDNFLELSNIEEEDKSEVSKNIIVDVNTNMFNLKR